MWNFIEWAFGALIVVIEPLLTLLDLPRQYNYVSRRHRLCFLMKPDTLMDVFIGAGAGLCFW